MDASVAYRQTSLRAIEYLRRYGYDDYQSYLLLGCAPIQGHVAGIVDVSIMCSHENYLLTDLQIPNACTTLGLPIDIFDFDISVEKPAEKKNMGKCALASDNAGAPA
jgi:formamidase